MAGAPTAEPVRYVCRDCYVVSAGRPSDGGSTVDYDPPGQCGACGGTNFVEYSEFERVE